MSRSASFGLILLFLLTALVAAAWGAHTLGLTDQAPAYARAEAGAKADPVCAYVPGRLYAMPSAAEVAASRASFAAAHVCYYTPGQMFAPPSAAQVAEARASWSWASVCLYDPSRGFGAFPTAAELAKTRALLWSFGPGAAGLGSLIAAIGTMSLGHGLLVNGLSIFNPAFVSVGWWLLLPEIALAQAGWIGMAGLGTAALTLLAPRYVRRRQSIEAMRRGPRGWLTPRRIAIVGGGWMMTVGVLAGVYPNIAKLIPQIPGVTVSSTAMPKTGGGSKIAADSGQPAAQAPVTQTAMADVVPALGAMPPLPAAAGGDAQAPSQSQASSTTPAMPRMPSMTPSVETLSGGNSGVQGGNTASSDSAASPVAVAQNGNLSTPAIPTTASFAAVSNYLPPSTPASSPSASASAPATSPMPAAATPPVPVTASPAPVQIVANDDARSAIAETPIIEASNPLPSGPDAVLPTTVAPPSPQTAGDNGGTPTAPQGQSQPALPGTPPATLAPANPGALAGDTLPVPEPGMIGLFGLGVLALVRRRAK